MAADDPGPTPGARPAPDAEPVVPEVTPLDSYVTEVTETVAEVEVTYPEPPYPHQQYPQQHALQQHYPQQQYPQQQYPQPSTTQPPYPQPPAPQSPYSQLPPPQPLYYGWGTPPPPPPPRVRTPRRAVIGALVIILVAAGAIAGGLQLARTSSGASAQPTTGDVAKDAAARAVWRTTPISQLLPPTITREGSESYIRLGINPDESCKALPSAFSVELTPAKCAHLLSATYVDRTQTVTATVGIVVISGSITERLRLFQAWNADTAATKGSMMPHVYAVPGTVAAAFSDKQRVAWQSQLSVDGTYLAYAVTGFTDGRTGSNNAAIAAGSGSALSSSSPPVQVAGDLPAAIQDLLTPKINDAKSAQGGASSSGGAS